MTQQRRWPTRRRWLESVVATLAGVGTAGCSGDDEESTTETEPTESTPAPGETATEPDTEGTPIHADYETTDVRVETEGGEMLGRVTAAVADTPSLRFTGLSKTEQLPEDRGMLFVFESVADRTFVMRGMDFGIDIVYADADGTITRIHHAPAPGPDENGSEQRYLGRGQYVLEVGYEWTSDRGVSTGDVLRFDL